MATPKPTIVLISGGWHTPITYSKFTAALKAAGYEVHVPRLLSINEARPPNADLATDTDIVRGYVESLIDAGRTVIAVMHSYGGQVGTNALHGLGTDARSRESRPGGVSHLIYMCGSALSEGQSQIDKVKEFGDMDFMMMLWDLADDFSCVLRDPKTLLVGQGVDDAEADAYVSSLVRWNGKVVFQGLSNCAWRTIPVTYIHTKQDKTLFPHYQKSMVEYMQAEGCKVHTVELDTGHCPNLTMTKEVVDVVNQVVAGIHTKSHDHVDSSCQHARDMDSSR